MTGFSSLVFKFFNLHLNSNLDPLKNYVSNGDVATEVKRLISLGQKEGYILYAGTNNTGLPPSKTDGVIHYANSIGTMITYLMYMRLGDIYYGYLGSDDTIPTWRKAITSTDFPFTQIVNSDGYLTAGQYGFYEDPADHKKYIVVFDSDGIWGMFQAAK